MKSDHRFSKHTIDFLKKASRQKRQDWLEKHRSEYETAVLEPLKNLARFLKSELQPLAPDYNFPQKGIGRLRRPARQATERGKGLYKSWMTYSASRPRESRFEHNPNLYFMIDTNDPKDTVLVAGGLYMPSSRQLRALREAVARDASAFDTLFSSRDFAKCFRGGFSLDVTSKRVPRGFDPTHPRIEWIKLQAFFVWRPYSRREFASKNFPELVARDWKQVLRLNKLLDQALAGQESSTSLLGRLSDVEHVERQMDF